MKKKYEIRIIATWVILAIALALAVTIYIMQLPPPAHKYDAFAKCIASASTTFYGAFWCPHCMDQKRMFGTGAAFLPYVECSTPDGHETTACAAAGVTRFPTWVFKDGSRAEGVLPLADLSKRTGCPLPTSTKTEEQPGT